MNRIRVHLIVAAEYHDADFARRELLGLLGADARIATVCTNDYHDAASLLRSNLLLTYTNNVFPTDGELEALRAFLNAGGRWLAIPVSEG